MLKGAGPAARFCAGRVGLGAGLLPCVCVSASLVSKICEVSKLNIFYDDQLRRRPLGASPLSPSLSTRLTPPLSAPALVGIPLSSVHLTPPAAGRPCYRAPHCCEVPADFCRIGALLHGAHTIGNGRQTHLLSSIYRAQPDRYKHNCIQMQLQIELEICATGSIRSAGTQ